MSKFLVLTLTVLAMAFVMVPITHAAPIVGIQGLPEIIPVCLDDGNDVKQVDFVVNMNDAPEKASRFAWNFLVNFDQGLLPATGTYEAVTCLPAHADSCCNYCNGFHMNGSLRDDIGPRIYQFGYAGTPCTGTCGSGSCTGTTSGKFMKMWVKLDMAYWATQSPGRYERSVTLYNENNPADENLWSCCGGSSGIDCESCGGTCHRLGFSFGSSSVTVCVIVHSDLAGKQSTVTATVQSAPSHTGPFETTVTQQMNAPAQNPCTWGKVKSTYR